MARPIRADFYERPGRTYRLSELGALSGPTVAATMAFPLADETYRRQEMAEKLKLKIDDELAVKATGQASTGHWIIDQRRLRSGFAWMETRLQKRLEFGRLVLQSILATQTSQAAPRLLHGRLNIAASLQEATAVSGTSAPNYYRDWIRPGRPVAHLCAAWYAILLQAEKRNDELPTIYAFGADPDFLESMVLDAADLESRVVGHLGVTDDLLIRFRLG